MWDRSSNLEDAFNIAFAAAFGLGNSGELENLAQLFSPAAINNYRQALAVGLTVGSEASIDVAWIDKRPIAVLNLGEDGAELGDMMLVVHEHYPDGTQESRACLLEVKQAPKDPPPAVPVTSGDSTENQFKILSNWPTIYGLKKTGSNNAFLLTNIVTWRPPMTLDAVLAQAWYVAVKPPVAGLLVDKPWVAAPAVDGSEFEHTLGQLFAACLRGTTLTNKSTGKNIGVGRSFKVGNTLQTPYGWDALINTIVFVAQSYRMPKSYYYWSSTSRYFLGTVVAGIAPVAGAVPIQLGADWHLLSVVALGGLVALAVFSIYLLVMKSKPRRGAVDDDQSAIMERWFPILTFSVRHAGPREGPRERPISDART